MQPTFQAYSLANKSLHNSNDWFNIIKNKNEPQKLDEGKVRQLNDVIHWNTM